MYMAEVHGEPRRRLVSFEGRYIYALTAIMIMTAPRPLDNDVIEMLGSLLQ